MLSQTKVVTYRYRLKILKIDSESYIKSVGDLASYFSSGGNVYLFFWQSEELLSFRRLKVKEILYLALAFCSKWNSTRM